MARICCGAVNTRAGAMVGSGGVDLKLYLLGCRFGRHFVTCICS